MGSVVVMLSFGFMAWTYVPRQKFVVAAAQPIFLVQLCLGTVLMAFSLIPFSMQGKTSSPKSVKLGVGGFELSFWNLKLTNEASSYLEIYIHSVSSLPDA